VVELLQRQENSASSASRRWN